ncbi:MAG: D-alanine--D-alanine ligase [Bacteroidota bacterium]
MKRNIAVIAGGDSQEYAISIKSSEQVVTLIDQNLYNAYLINIRGKDWFCHYKDQKLSIDKNDFSFIIQGGAKINIDFALIIIHGTPGEDGILQAYLDLVKIPYSTCGFFESALAFNKNACKLFLKEYGILSPIAVIVRKNENFDVNKIAQKLTFPCFVKPNEGGSSFGTTKAKNRNELEESIRLALNEDNEVIIEEFIEGTEVTCGVIKTKNNYYRLPPTEIVSKNEFFDYEAKYNGESDEITPARISENKIKECQDISSYIYDVLNCKGIVRIDYIIKNDRFYFLEINTVPGMSSASIIPQMAKVAKISLTKVYTEIIEDNFK